MPLKLSGPDRKLFIAVAVVFALLVVGGVFFSSKAGSRAEVPSSYSTASGGAKAAYLLLEESGYHVARWQRPLKNLSDPAGKILILADPEEAPTREDKAQLQQFIADGGHVIVTGMFATAFLPQGSSAPDFVEGMLWKKTAALSPSSITRQAPVITIAPESHWSGLEMPLYGEEGKARVVKYSFGKGEVMWWAAATPLTNAGLREPDNLAFFLASIGEGQQILWDEYIHGYRDTLGGSIARSPILFLVLQSALIGVAVLLTFSRRSGPIFQPAKDVRLSPLEFVNTLGGLYQRAGAGSVAVDISYQRFRYWLTRRYGMASNASAEDLQRAARERSLLEDEQFEPTLRQCESARYDSNLTPEQALLLIRRLHDYATQLKLFPTPRER